MGGRRYIRIVGKLNIKDMKSWFDIARQILPVFFLLLMCGACSNDEMPGNKVETVSLGIEIPMLQDASRSPIQGTPEEDAIYNLRVVLLSEGSEGINKAFSKEELETSGGNLTIDNVPVGDVQMYVIANEGAIGKDYTRLEDLQADLEPIDGHGHKAVIKDPGRNYFPKRGSEKTGEVESNAKTKGLPMSYMQKIKVLPQSEAPQSVSVNLERCVAKLNIIMMSSLSEDLLIKEINFGKFFGDRFCLFKEVSLDVPDDCEYDVKKYTNLDITVPANGDITLVCYIYPSFAWKNPGLPSDYTIGFKTMKNGREFVYDPLRFIRNGVAFNSIARNTQVNITAKLSKPANIELNFDVEPWVRETVDVPSFN